MTGDPVVLAISMGALVFSCVFHECSHVWVAGKLGDPTGKQMGRLTLNPIPHIDILWTLILPLTTYLMGGIAFGGPKPAPVEPRNFRDPRTGFMWTALAGPASNILLAVASFLLLWLLETVAPGFIHDDQRRFTYNAMFLVAMMLINTALAAFNLIPIPPLDGSRFLMWILGDSVERLFRFLEYSAAILMILLAIQLAPYAFRPFVHALIWALAHVFGPVYANDLLIAYVNS